MASSAKATYFATPEHGKFRYIFLIRNTSSGQFDIYAVLIAAQYDIPVVPGGLQNIVPLNSPPRWQLIPSTPPYGFLSGQTSFAGTPAASGYILPGAVAAFVFQSSTPPAETLPYGCAFYNENNEWGFAYDGTAERVDCVPISEFPRPWPWPYPIIELPPAVPFPETSMLGTTSLTIGGKDGGPSVNITHDRFGNIIKMSPNPPKSSPSRTT
jgi:hypothetical protein